MLSTPAVPTTSSTAATCSAAEVTSVSNYLPANTYTFSPTGPTVGAGGAITGMTGTTSYTVTATNNGCTSLASSSFSNDAMLVSPVYSSINVLCSGPALTSVTVNATVSSGTMEYSLDGITFQASNIFTSGMTLGSNSTFYIRTVGTTCVVNSGPQPINCNCSTVTGNTITAPQSICSGITPASLTGSIPLIIPVFAYTYQWQSSTDNTVWTDISLATAQDYAPGSLTQSTYYRRVVKMAGCPDNNSANVMITVNATPVFTDVTIVCSGTTLSSATVNATLTSGTMEYSLDGTNYQSSNVFTTGITVGATQTFYIRTVGSTCSTSGSQLISCSCSTVSGNTISAAQSICSGVAPASLMGNTVTITPTYAFTYQWQSSNDNSAWADISGAISKDYAPGSLTQSTYYRRVVKMTGCPDDNSTSIMITVNSAPNLVITDPQSTCFPSTIDLTAIAVTSGSSVGGVLTYWNDLGATNSLNGPSLIATSGTYFIKSTSNGCFVVKAVTATINNTPSLVINNPAAICAPGTVNLTQASVTAGSTNMGTNSYFTDIACTIPVASPTSINTNGTFYIKSLAGNCFDIKPVMVTINPIPTVLVGATASGCAPLKVNLTDPNLTAGSTQGSTFNYWTDNLATNTLATPASVSNGIYFITGTLNGCKSSSIQVVVTIHPLPIADYSPTPALVSTLNAETLLKNNSIGGETYFWDFGDGKFSQEVSPYHTYPDLDTATFFPYLIVTSQFGCIDTIVKKVKVYEELVYFIPNTFTPDEDDFNNTFHPVFVTGYDPYNFVMYIYNRWGELIFETHDSKIGWKGTYGLATEIAKEGVYTWKINFNLKSDDRRKEITGHVNLIK